MLSCSFSSSLEGCVVCCLYFFSLFQTFRVAVGVRGATLHHKMSTSGHSWFKQLTDFFDILDYPVAGYDRPCVITELHLHFWDCAIDYRSAGMHIITHFLASSSTVLCRIHDYCFILMAGLYIYLFDQCLLLGASVYQAT